MATSKAATDLFMALFWLLLSQGTLMGGSWRKRGRRLPIRVSRSRTNFSSVERMAALRASCITRYEVSSMAMRTPSRFLSAFALRESSDALFGSCSCSTPSL